MSKRVQREGSCLPIATSEAYCYHWHWMLLQLTAGTATSFTAVSNPATRHRRLASTEEVYHLPDKPGADDAGTLFFPPCKEVLTCNASTIVTSLVNPLAEKLVFQQCIPLNTITKATSMVATGLSNATLYRVLTIHSDTNRYCAPWMYCTAKLNEPTSAHQLRRHSKLAATALPLCCLASVLMTLQDCSMQKYQHVTSLLSCL